MSSERDTNRTRAVGPKSIRRVTDSDAQRVLRRFRSQVRWAAHVVTEAFEPRIEFADAEQEANILVLGYAGLLDTHVHVGAIARAQRDAHGDERRIRKIIGTKLRLDLTQRLGRREEVHDKTCISLESLPVGAGPSYEPENGWITSIDIKRYVRKEYPYLCMHAIDELTVKQIAQVTREGVATVNRKLADEKESAAVDPWFLDQDEDRARSHRARNHTDYELTA